MSDLKKHNVHVEEDGGYSYTPVYVSNYLGDVEISVCTSCGLETAHCSHSKATWIGPDGDEHLICDLCGEDVT
jgi:hypothetical protein